MTSNKQTSLPYRNYNIPFVCPPIGCRDMDYHFHHEDFDLDDDRCGSGPSVEDCKKQIDEQIAEGEDN